MNEDRFGSRVRQALNHGIKDISPASSRRLEAARHLALSHQKQTAPELALANGRSGMLNLMPNVPYLKQAMSILALLLGMWISFYWHSVQYVTELQEIDSALLADDMPPEAFLDNDFFTWLKNDSSED